MTVEFDVLFCCFCVSVPIACAPSNCVVGIAARRMSESSDAGLFCVLYDAAFFYVE